MTHRTDCAKHAGKQYNTRNNHSVKLAALHITVNYFSNPADRSFQLQQQRRARTSKRADESIHTSSEKDNCCLHMLAEHTCTAPSGSPLALHMAAAPGRAGLHSAAAHSAGAPCPACCRAQLLPGTCKSGRQQRQSDIRLQYKSCCSTSIV
jgi:hypothetical protein